ncbi:MAG TPA: aminotransferase class I/II-fold pyridoxal phosphate-dependent enzyme [Blastocatellia bacterium]|nr:aminotransferase class I/II-fold pyridoxal phosphate-dependent enzyme [Blastocatellia bacterium]
MNYSSKRTANFHYAIRNLVRAAEARHRAGRDVIYLNIGDPQRYGFRPPEYVVEAVTRALRDNFTGYAPSAGLPEARAAVAAYATGLGAPTSADDVVITSGASEAADLVLTALVDEGDEVLIPAPGYSIYTALVNKLGAVPRYYRLDDSQVWLPSLDEVRSLINERTRAIILINPNNPTGSVIPDEMTAGFLELAARHNLLVIADEVYRELCFEEQPAPASALAYEMGLPLVTLESLSKTHQVPGWRVGWLRYTRPEKLRGLMTGVNRLADGRLCSPTPAQYAVRPALEDDRQFLNDFTGEIRRRRDFALRCVRDIEGLSCVTPRAAFYMMVQASDAIGQDDEKFVLDILEETGVLVVHGSGFDADARQGYFRLVYLASEETLDLAFSAIRRYLETCCVMRET